MSSAADPLDCLAPDSLLELRDGMACFVERDGDSVVIFSSYHEVRGPLMIAPALEFVREHRRFRIADLPQLRDDASRLVLARRLVREGFLRIVEGDRTADMRRSPDATPAPGRTAAGKDDKGTLVLVGTGIKSLAHMTVEAQAWMRAADVVCYCTSDPATDYWIKHNARHCVDLNAFYSQHRQRSDVYAAMVEAMMAPVRQGQTVCAFFYGHPGLFVMPSHQAIATARAEGHDARMLPGVSATDCLYADVGFDPGDAGAQYYEATDLLVHRRVLHPENSVVIWQIGSVGNATSVHDSSKLPILIEYLEQFYDPECRVVHYQGSVFPGCQPVVEKLPLRELGQGARITNKSTLFIPRQRLPEIDYQMAWRLGMVPGSSPRGAEPPQGDGGLPEHRPIPDRSPLAEFVLSMATDAGRLLEFEADPAAAAADCELSEKERKALLTRMPRRIWSVIEEGP